MMQHVSFRGSPGVEVEGDAPPPMTPPRFLADCHLGRLARHLRFAGFDTLFCPETDDTRLLERAFRERRLLLTRDRELAHRGQSQALLLRAVSLEAQLKELNARLPLAKHFAPFTRCMVCNTPLEKIPKARLPETVPPRVRESFDDFRHCPGCGRIYWRGDHYAAMIRQWERLREKDPLSEKSSR